MATDSVILVIPVYNEEACIEKVINEWHEELNEQKIAHEILLVNDGSTDNTPSILDKISQKNDQIKIIHQLNQGHGVAVKNGYIAATNSHHNYIFQTDSDDQFSPQDFIKFWKRRTESSAIFGHRVSRKDPLSRKIISLTLRKILFDFFDADIPDANIPYRLFQKNYLKSCLSILNPGLFAPNIFLSIYSFRALSKPIVIPVRHFARQGDTQKLMSFGLFKACLKSFWQVVTFYYQMPKKLIFLKEINTNNPFLQSTKESPLLEASLKSAA